MIKYGSLYNLWFWVYNVSMYAICQCLPIIIILKVNQDGHNLLIF